MSEISPPPVFLNPLLRQPSRGRTEGASRSVGAGPCAGHRLLPEEHDPGPEAGPGRHRPGGSRPGGRADSAAMPARVSPRRSSPRSRRAAWSRTSSRPWTTPHRRLRLGAGGGDRGARVSSGGYFARIEEVARPRRSSPRTPRALPAVRLFSELKHPGRTTVTHFFAPAFQNPAVEVVRWRDGDPEVVEWLRWLFAATGKVPFVTGDVPCFMLDRVFDNWCNEAGHLLAHRDRGRDRRRRRRVRPRRPLLRPQPRARQPDHRRDEHPADGGGEAYRPAPIFPLGRPLAHGRTRDRGRGRPEGREADPRPPARILFSQSVDVADRAVASPSDLNLGCVLALGFRQGPFDLMRELGGRRSTGS